MERRENIPQTIKLKLYFSALIVLLKIKQLLSVIKRFFLYENIFSGKIRLSFVERCPLYRGWFYKEMIMRNFGT